MKSRAASPSDLSSVSNLLESPMPQALIGPMSGVGGVIALPVLHDLGMFV
jgi:hypothetical protein